MLDEEEGKVEGHCDPVCGPEMLTECLDRLDRVVRVALDLHPASSGPEPALEPYPAHDAGPELDTEADHLSLAPVKGVRAGHP